MEKEECMSQVTMIVVGAVGLLVIICIAIFNRLVSLKMRASEAWSQIDV